jgi:hypothetical protein
MVIPQKSADLFIVAQQLNLNVPRTENSKGRTNSSEAGISTVYTAQKQIHSNAQLITIWVDTSGFEL